MLFVESTLTLRALAALDAVETVASL